MLCRLWRVEPAAKLAERLHGPLTKSPFLVRDNGTRFTARRFKAFLGDDCPRVRIAYRTPTRLELLERLHRTLTEEEVHWRLAEEPAHARRCLAEFREQSNERRPHWAQGPVRDGDVVPPVEGDRQGGAVGQSALARMARRGTEEAGGGPAAARGVAGIGAGGPLTPAGVGIPVELCAGTLLTSVAHSPRLPKLRPGEMGPRGRN